MSVYKNVQITVKNDDEGFLGSDPASIASVNVPESVSAYEAQLREELAAAFPGAKITLEYGPYGGRSVIVSIDQENTQEITEEEISEETDEIVARVYNRGTFWDYK